MTAEGCIWNYKQKKFEKTVFFFDTGAQKTVIREDLAFRLGLLKVKTETCVTSGIGGNTETFESHIVNVRLGTTYGKDMEILIQTKPVLTNGFPAVKKLCYADQQFLQERSLVCNPSIRGESQFPEVLVGLDYSYNFVLKCRTSHSTPSGLSIANTIFGPTL